MFTTMRTTLALAAVVFMYIAGCVMMATRISEATIKTDFMLNTATGFRLKTDTGEDVEDTLARFVNQGGTLHFIHIGKTGGTYAIDSGLFERLRTPHHHPIIVNHWHWLILGNLEKNKPDPRNHMYIFFVRDPVDRWISSHLSRLRQGCPCHCHTGGKKELEAFHLFPTPNSLAERIGTELGKEANERLFHNQRDIAFYMNGIDNLRLLTDKIAFVGDSRHIDRDMITLYKRLGREAPVISKNVASHAAPESLKDLKYISPYGLCELEDHLWEDYEVTDFLHANGFIEAPFKRRCNRTAADLQLTAGDVLPIPSAKFEDWDFSNSTAMKDVRCKNEEVNGRIPVEQTEIHMEVCARIYEHIEKGDLFETAADELIPFVQRAVPLDTKGWDMKHMNDNPNGPGGYNQRDTGLDDVVISDWPDDIR